MILLSHFGLLVYAEAVAVGIIANSNPQNNAKDVPILIDDFYVEFSRLLDIKSIKESFLILTDITDKVAIKIPIGLFWDQINKDSFLRKMIEIKKEEDRPNLVSKISITVNPNYCLLLHGHEYKIEFEGTLKDEEGEELDEKPVVRFKTIDALATDSIEIPDDIGSKDEFAVKIRVKNNINRKEVNEKAKREIMGNTLKIDKIDIDEGFDINFQPQEITFENVGEVYEIKASCIRKKSDSEIMTNSIIYNVSGVVYASFDRFWSNKEYLYTENIQLPFNQSEAKIDTKVGKDIRTNVNTEETIQLEMELESRYSLDIDKIEPSLKIKPQNENAPIPEIKKVSGKKWSLICTFEPTGPSELEFIVIFKGYSKGKLLLQSEGHCFVKVWLPSDIKVNLRSPGKVSVGQVTNIEVDIKNGDNKNVADAGDIDISLYIKDDQKEYLIGEQKIHKLSGSQATQLKFSYIGNQDHLGEKKIYAIAKYKDGISGKVNERKYEENIKIETAPEITINLVEPTEKKVIGIDKSLSVTFRIANKGQTTVKVMPQDNDLNISDYGFSVELISKREIKLSGSSEEIKYEITAKKGEVISGNFKIKLKKLDLVNENDGKSIELDFLKDLGLSESAEITVDMDKPELMYAMCEDVNENGVLDFGDIIKLIFNEEINTMGQKIEDCFSIVPKIQDADPFGKGARISKDESDNKVLKIFLGEESSIKAIDSYSIKATNVFDLAGNPVKDKSVEIQFPTIISLPASIDNVPPKILGIKTNFYEGNKASLQYVIWLRVKDEPPETASGVNIDSLEIFNNDREINKDEYTIIKPKKEFKADDIIDIKILLKNLTTLSTHRLTIKIKDRNENESKEDIELIFEKQQEIEIKTFPNPVALNVSSINIMYKINDKQNVNNSGLHINIYDSAGCLVKRFIIENPLSMDYFQWDGRTDAGEQLSAGVYVCELVFGKYRKYWNIAIYPHVIKK